MSKKIKYWCYSGANIHSCRHGEITLDELDLTEAEWNSISEYEQDEIMREIACDILDWGYELEDSESSKYTETRKEVK